jgi:high-affinity nickel permease
LFFALVFVLVVLGVVVVVVVFFPLLFGGGMCLRGFIDVFGSVFFVAYGLL